MKLYGIWAPDRGWWFASFTVFHTEHYSVALAQLETLQRHFAEKFDGSDIQWEIKPLPDTESEEISEPTRD